MWSVVELLQKRVLQLEEDRAVMQLELRTLRGQLARPKFTRGPYETRAKSVGIPSLGWGEFSENAFLDGCRKSATYLEQNGLNFHSSSQLIAGAWYLQNGSVKLISSKARCPRDKYDRPVRVWLNRKGSQREVSLDTAINTIFQNLWLPPWETVHKILRNLLYGEGEMERMYKRTRNFAQYMPSACAKEFESYKVRYEVIRSLATLTIPTRQVVAYSDKEKAAAHLADWNGMCERDGRWWTHTDPKILATDYDYIFSDVPAYRKTIKKYFSSHEILNKDVAFVAADGKMEMYITAGGLFA
jgi:hypothetical protein